MRIKMSRLSNLLKRIKMMAASNEQYIEILRDEGIRIGVGCTINKDVVFGTEPYLISIGDNVRVTLGVKFITHDGGIFVPRNLGLIDQRADKIGEIRIGNNVNIGWNAIIMPGVAVGNNVIVAAGAIVVRDVPDNSVVAGIPAKVIETIEEYAEKNKGRVLMTKQMADNDKEKYLLEYFRIKK